MKNFWKRSISLLLVLCTLVGYIVLPDVPAAKAETETEATNPNLVENGTFETHLADDTVKANTTGWGNMSGFWSVVAEEGKENNYVAKVADTSASSGRYIYYGFSVEPGETYTFKIDYKGAYTSGAPDLYVRQNAYNGTNLHKKGALALSADTWQTYETTVDVPASATKVFIVVASGTAAKGTAYFDNVSFTKGVNIGGAGTLIASLASLITYQQFVRYAPGEGGKFFKLFTVINVAFLAVLLVVMKII